MALVILLEHILNMNMTMYLGGHNLLGPNQQISVFRVTGLKILGRVGTHLFFWK